MFFNFGNTNNFPFNFQEENSIVPSSFAQFFGYPQE